MRFVRGMTVTVLLTAILLVSACSGDVGSSGASGAGQSEAGFVSGSGAVTTIPESERKPAPELAGETLDGSRVDLAEFAGQVVVVNVWGSWCPPCRKEAPELAAAAEALQDDNVQFLGINIRDNDPVAPQRFVAKSGLDYPNIYDPDGRLLLGFRETIPPSAIPSTLVIDKKGRVAARVLGDTTRTTFEQLAKDVAAES